MSAVVNAPAYVPFLLRQFDGTPITGATSGGSYTTAPSAKLLPSGATTAAVTLTEIGGGWYCATFAPSAVGDWLYAHVYDADNDWTETVQVETAAQADLINTPTVSGESWALGDQLASLMRCGPAQYRVPATIHVTDPRSGAMIQLIVGTCLNIGWAEELGLLT